ncbi:MAG: YicC family protein [Planctomycetes bacterium]|nr:YicC family protein [Planctomycetota bacterium]
MIRSMTGFGRAATSVEGLDLSVEVKSVNHRFLKVSSRLPEALNGLEAQLESLTRVHLKRGAVNVSINVGTSGSDNRRFVLNRETIKRYFLELKAIAQDLGIEATESLASVARLQGAVETQDLSALPEEKLAETAQIALNEALAKCVQARSEEGKALANDLTQMCQSLVALNERVRERAPQVVVAYRDRLKERVAKLLEGSGVDARAEDIAREVAFFADRSDINEEVQRLAHHIESMLGLVNESDDEAGRRLEFIAQEMLREANTMGSKANDGELSGIVLEMKSTIEKIKEQVQNVE